LREYRTVPLKRDKLIVPRAIPYLEGIVHVPKNDEIKVLVPINMMTCYPKQWRRKKEGGSSPPPM